MEYNELIEKAQHAPVDTPDTDVILGGMHHTLNRRRQHNTLLATAACLIVASAPLFFSLTSQSPAPTLAEVVSATIQSSPNDLPAPIAGYRNSIRNHNKIITLI